MPELSAYLKGFGITHNKRIGEYTLMHIEGSHRQVVRFSKYEYPITLTFTPQYKDSNPDTLLSDLKKMTKKSRVINSAYGNPYECDFGNPEINEVLSDGTVIIETTGHSHRI